MNEARDILGEYKNYVNHLKEFFDRESAKLPELGPSEPTREQIQMRIVLKMVQKEIKQAEEEFEFFTNMNEKNI